MLSYILIFDICVLMFFLCKSEAPRTTRDDKRRAQHNEVERRRRDKINNWIVQLSKTIPDCTIDATKTGQSKGGILSKACDYIQEMRQSNLRLGEELNSLDRLRLDNQLLRQQVLTAPFCTSQSKTFLFALFQFLSLFIQVEEWKTKNQILRNQLRQHGIVGAATPDPQ
ncbi:Upstream stimulatory factor 1 [Acipenser ruthenus]|uniref:Upstream stimulatory factor 1 n=1 Tax=Acipenser ruthenus TaxID=7906 RepID=A0A444UQW0_ACIRT|nr:Upstream stimulatory factor 1 [Acipenser ruthenus]